LWGRIFEPPTDFYTLLDRHARKALEGVEALQEWVVCENREERCQRVRDLENEADVLKMELGRKLDESFVTPFDREDIFELSNRMDEVINSAKSAIREIEAYEINPTVTPNLAELLEILVEGTRALVQSIHLLRNNLPDSSAQALIARKAENRFAKAYRASMKELLQMDDVRHILRAKEVYRSLMQMAEKIDRVGEKLQHCVIKMS